VCCSVLQCDAVCTTSGHAQQSRGRTFATCLHLYVLIFTHPPHLHMFRVSPFHTDLPDLLLLIYIYHIFPLLVSTFTSQHWNTHVRFVRTNRPHNPSFSSTFVPQPHHTSTCIPFSLRPNLRRSNPYKSANLIHC